MRITQTVVSSTPEESIIYSQPVIFAATVVSTYLPGVTPTGTIRFEIDGIPVATQTLINQETKFTTTKINVGAIYTQHSIEGIYSGDDIYAPSKDVLNLTVYPANTSSTISAWPNPAVFGQEVKVVAQLNSIEPATALPNGMVQFHMDGENGVAVPLDASGQATFSTREMAVGTHIIRAIYLGNENFNKAASRIIQTIGKANSATSITSSTNPSIYGQTISFTGKVSSETGKPGGTIRFTIDGNSYDNPVLLNGHGEASLTIKDLSSGNHTIGAYYSGDSSFSSSNFSVNQQVQKAETSISVSSSTNPSTYGQEITFEADVSSKVGQPTGVVQFTINGNEYDNPVLLNDNGKAVISIAWLASGDQNIGVYYSGDPNFSSSNHLLHQKVHKAKTVITISSSDNPSVVGEPVTLTAQVSPPEKLEGSIQFHLNGKNLGKPVLLNGSDHVSVTLSSDLKTGEQKIIAIYSGDENHHPSTSSPLKQVARLAILEPVEVKSFQEENPLKDGTKVNVLQWQVPQGSEVPKSYRIFRDPELKNLAAEIPATQTLEFIDPIHIAAPVYQYYIVSVDALGNESKPASITVNANGSKEKGSQ